MKLTEIHKLELTFEELREAAESYWSRVHPGQTVVLLGNPDILYANSTVSFRMASESELAKLQPEQKEAV